MLDFDGLVTQLRSAEGGGWDVSPTQAGVVLNRWIKRLAAISKWVKDEVDLGLTVVGQDTYDCPANVLDLHELVIGGLDTKRESRRNLFKLKNGTAWLVGPPYAVFAPVYSSDGTHRFQIYPGPGDTGDVTTGLQMSALCSVVPSDLSGSQAPPFPDDFENTLLTGAKSQFYRELEEDHDTGDRLEAEFLRDAEDLRRRGNTQMSDGFFQIPVGR